MKRFFLFISLISFSIAEIHGQHSVWTCPGGEISGTWNSYDTVYVTGEITISSGTLTISPNTSGSDVGTYIIFLGGFGISVSSSGALVVNGTASENVIFTADRAEATLPKGDKTFGEAGEIWKNLSFDGSTGNSSLNYAIVEFGSGDSYDVGGGIDIYDSNISVQNTTIRNCTTVGDGGGLFVEPVTASVSLQNLKIYNNTADNNGGGLFANGPITIENSEIHNNNSIDGDGIYLNSTSNINRCAIYSNSGSGVYVNATGSTLSNCILYSNTYGIIFAFSSNVANCDIVGNTTGLRSISFVAPKIVNSVLWGNGTEYSIGGSSNKLEFANSAIEGGLLGLLGEINGGNNQNLSSTNTADTGPNFVDPSSFDFHINSRISPMVDGGISSYSGIAIPAADFDNSSRLSTNDIGAYEFFYYIWTGSVSNNWTTSGNWVGSPASVPISFSEERIIIPNGCVNYPVLSGPLSLSNRSFLTLEPLAKLEVTGITTVNTGCTFLIRSNASGTANFICAAGSGTVSGSFKVEMYLAGGGDPNYKWHFFTTPVDYHSTDPLTIDISNENLMNYLESKVLTSKDEGWQWYDGYNSTIGFSELRFKKGYNVYVPNDHVIEFNGTIWDGRDASWTNTELTCGTYNPDENGWNLIGNPFTSVVDAETFVFGADLLGPDPLDRVIYFLKDYSYVSYNSYTHVGIGASRYVPALQGFFVHGKAGRTKTLRIPASGRVSGNSTLYKRSASASSYISEFPYLKLDVSDGGTPSDETIVYFFNDASISFDGMYDAYKLFSKNPSVTQIYTVSNSVNYAINGLPYPETTTSIPLKIWIGESKNYSINVLNLENLSDYRIKLIHGENVIDLNSNPTYTFSGVKGTTANMILTFENIATVLPDNLIQKGNPIQSWYKNGILSIKTNVSGLENSCITIYDLYGNTRFIKDNFYLSQGEIIELPVNLKNGVYILKVNNLFMKFSNKLIAND